MWTKRLQSLGARHGPGMGGEGHCCFSLKRPELPQWPSVCACSYIHVCVWKRSLMSSQCAFVLGTTTVIYVKILSLLLLSLFSLHVDGPSPFCTVRLCPSFALFALCPHLSTLLFSLSFYFSSSLLITVTSSYSIQSVCLFVLTLQHPLESFIQQQLVSCLPSLSFFLFLVGPNVEKGKETHCTATETLSSCLFPSLSHFSGLN